MNVLALVTDGFGGQGGIARYNSDLVTAVAQCGGSAVHDGLRRVLRKDLKQQAKFLWQIQLRAIEAIFELKTLRFDLKPHYTAGQKNVEHELGVIFDSVPQVSDDFCP